MVWRSLNLVLSPIRDWHGRWQKGGVTKKFTCIPLPFFSFLLCFFGHWSNKVPFFIPSNVFLSLDMFLYVLPNRVTEEKPGWCSDPHLPPCAAYALSSILLQIWMLYCNIIYLDFLSFVYLVNLIISSVILDLWKLWLLSFLAKLGVVCGTWFRYILFFFIEFIGYSNVAGWTGKSSLAW